ncbi:MAG: 2-C-methyl-D-erythritol 4-phosphate cytidylyltransferase [Planctomycetota bacterium]|nr:2-C-methyl-D-erythritol 4-phosphate cytidylyltransferase [Planctomycetota bacterium]
MKVAMLLLAAGRGSRFGGAIPKAYLPLAGRAVLLRSADRLLATAKSLGEPHELVLVVGSEDREPHLAGLRGDLEALGATVVDGGKSRQESMQRGLAAASPDCDLVLVHDAARPLFPIEATCDCIRRAAQTGAALLAIPTADTLKRVGSDGLVETTIDRSNIHAAQTPQVMQRKLLEQALEQAAASGLQATDDVSLIEAIGGSVAVVMGSSTNIKITQAADLALAEQLWSQQPSH